MPLCMWGLFEGATCDACWLYCLSWVSELLGLHGRRDRDGYSDRNKDKNWRMGLRASLGPERTSTENNFLWSLLFPAQGMTPDTHREHQEPLLCPAGPCPALGPKATGLEQCPHGVPPGDLHRGQGPSSLGTKSQSSPRPKPTWQLGPYRDFYHSPFPHRTEQGMEKCPRSSAGQAVLSSI